MQNIIYITLLFSFFTYSQSCSIFGEITFVEFGEDYRVKFVDFGEDCRVQFVSQFADRKGLWKIVSNSGGATKIKIVEFGEQLKVKRVNNIAALGDRNNLQSGKIDYQQSGTSQYNKYKDAYKYQSAGSAVGDGVDAAMEEIRMKRERAAQSGQYQASSNYSGYTPRERTEAEKAADMESTKQFMASPKFRKKMVKAAQVFLKKNKKHRKKYGVDLPNYQKFVIDSEKLGYIIKNGEVIDIGHPNK